MIPGISPYLAHEVAGNREMGTPWWHGADIIVAFRQDLVTIFERHVLAPSSPGNVQVRGNLHEFHAGSSENADEAKRRHNPSSNVKACPVVLLAY